MRQMSYLQDFVSVFLGVGVGFGVAVEQRRAGLEEEGEGDPDLPVGKKPARNGELAGEVQLLPGAEVGGRRVFCQEHIARTDPQLLGTNQ